MRILGCTLGYWHDQKMAEAKVDEYSQWWLRMQAFSPFELFVACGSWSSPDLCPHAGIKVVNAGVPYTKVYNGQKQHYGICAFTAAMAFALNRDDWDYLVMMDTETLVGDVNLPEIFRQFADSKAIVMAPAWGPWIGGPVLVWKRDGAVRLLHNRVLSNLRDDDEQDREMLWEQECAYIYRGGRWFNPWPHLESLLGFSYPTDPMRPITENWPFVGKPLAQTTVPFLEQCSPKLVPL